MMNKSTEHSEFSNGPVPVDGLPDYRRVDLNPVARNYYAYSLAVTGAFWLIMLVAVAWVPRLPFIPFDPGPWSVFVMSAATIWFCVIAWIDARRRGWVVREHDLIYRYGVIWQKTVIVPFARIQHVETASGPIERLFGLLRVKCFTAGGMMADLSVEGLDVRSARRVRQYLLEQIREDESDPDRPESNPADAGQSSDSEMPTDHESD
jgi:uncharacterized protein